MKDLSNARLIQSMSVAAVAIAVWFALRGWLPEAWRLPGSPHLYVTGVIGASLLLVPAAFAFAKRSGASRDPRGWFNAHVMCSLLGAVLVAFVQVFGEYYLPDLALAFMYLVMLLVLVMRPGGLLGKEA